MAMTEEEWHKVRFLLAPWLIGGCIDLLLQGVLFSQFANYYTWYKDDKPRLKIIVTILFIGTTLKSIQAFLIIWEQNIVYFTDVEGAVLLAYTTWWATGNGLMVASIGIYVQTYFLLRLYYITHRLLFVIPIAVILLFAYIGSIMATYYSEKADTPNIGVWYANHLSAAFAGDFLLTSATAYALLTSTGKHTLRQTNALINRLVALTWQTIAPAALCALCNLIFSQVYSGEDKLISAGFNMALPKLYAISMIWTLNARRSIRYGTSDGSLSLASSRDLSRRSRRAREDVELGRFGTVGTIHIRTDVETLQYVEGETRNDPAFSNSKGRDSPIASRRSDEASSNYKAVVV